MNTFQQWLLWMHIMGGSAIFVSIFVIHLRKRIFEKRFGALLKAQKEQVREHRRSLSANRVQPEIAVPVMEQGTTEQGDGGQAPTDIRHGLKSRLFDYGDGEKMNDSGNIGLSPSTEATMSPTEKNPLTRELSNTNEDHITFEPNISFHPSSRQNLQRRRSEVFTFTGVGTSPVRTTSFRRFNSQNTTMSSVNPQSRHTKTDLWHNRHFLNKYVVGRNSQFHGLTHEERENLGGIEYRALTLLSWIVPIYFVLWQLLGCLGIGAWTASYAADVTESNGINPW
jgi:Cation transport protein